MTIEQFMNSKSYLNYDVSDSVVKKKILFLDVDNTLVFDIYKKDDYLIKISGEERYISRKTIRLIDELRKDFYIVIATGRRLLNFEKIIEHIKYDYGILEHGAILVHTSDIDKKLYSQFIGTVGNFNTKKGIIWDYMKKLGSLGIETDSEGRYASFKIDPEKNRHYSKKRLESLLDKCPQQLISIKNQRFIDIIPREATKDLTMVYLIKKLGISASNVFFVGDDYNDLEALKMAKYSFTHSGAVKEVIAVVKKNNGYVSKHKDYNGINDILTRIKMYH